MVGLAVQRKKKDIRNILLISGSLDGAARLVQEAGTGSQTVKRLRLGESSDSSDSAGGSCASGLLLRDRKQSPTRFLKKNARR